MSLSGTGGEGMTLSKTRLNCAVVFLPSSSF